jgi:hypothetical protein
MANVLEKFGLRPSRQLNGSPFINAQNRYRIAANNTTAIFQGDLVIPKYCWNNQPICCWNFYCCSRCF